MPTEKGVLIIRGNVYTYEEESFKIIDLSIWMVETVS